MALQPVYQQLVLPWRPPSVVFVRILWLGAVAACVTFFVLLFLGIV